MQPYYVYKSLLTFFPNPVEKSYGFPKIDYKHKTITPFLSRSATSAWFFVHFKTLLLICNATAFHTEDAVAETGPDNQFVFDV